MFQTKIFEFTFHEYVFYCLTYTQYNVTRVKTDRYDIFNDASFTSSLGVGYKLYFSLLYAVSRRQIYISEKLQRKDVSRNGQIL